MPALSRWVCGVSGQRVSCLPTQIPALGDKKERPLLYEALVCLYECVGSQSYQLSKHTMRWQLQKPTWHGSRGRFHTDSDFQIHPSSSNPASWDGLHTSRDRGRGVVWERTGLFPHLSWECSAIPLPPVEATLNSQCELPTMGQPFMFSNPKDKDSMDPYDPHSAPSDGEITKHEYTTTSAWPGPRVCLRERERRGRGKGP